MNPITALTILTLNIWGLPDLGFRVLAPLRAERVQAICKALEKSTYDVVLLQEVWLEEDRKTFQHCGFSHAIDKNDPRRPLDSGLMILSRHPILRSEKIIYPEVPIELAREPDGETLAQKGAILAQIAHPSGKSFWIANTHLVSRYAGVDTYYSIRREQFILFNRWVMGWAKDMPLIVGGDFNFTPMGKLYEDLLPILSRFRQSPGSNESCTLCFPNTEHLINEGKVDYLMGTSHFTAVSGGQAMVEKLKMEDFEISLSDHLGWETLFQF